MKEAVVFGGVQALPGEKRQGYAPILGSGHTMPITVINGRKEGKTVLITSGVHGGEYPCIQTALELAAELDPGKVSGQIVLVHPVCVSSFMTRTSYYTPEDGKNINRAFPGDATGTLAEQIAYVLTHEFQDRADLYFDLHGGDLQESLPVQVYYPYFPEVPDASVAETCRSMADLVAARFKVKAPIASTAAVSAAVRGVPSLMIELGGRGLWSREDVDAYKRIMTNLLRYAGCIPGNPVLPETPAEELFGAFTQNSPADGAWYPTVGLGDEVAQGQKVGEVRDLLGQTIQEIYSEVDGKVVYLIVSLAVRASEPLLSIGLSQKN